MVRKEKLGITQQQLLQLNQLLDLVFDKYKGLDENITDMLEHWKIDDTCFKDIVKEIEF